jgi:hypothetical protein
MCSHCADYPVHKDWVAIVPVLDGEGRIMFWRDRFVIPDETLIGALAIARADYGPTADVRDRWAAFGGSG